MKNNFTIKFELDFEPTFSSKDLSESEKELATYYLRTRCIDNLIQLVSRDEKYTILFDDDLGQISASYTVKPIQISYEPILF